MGGSNFWGSPGNQIANQFSPQSLTATEKDLYKNNPYDVNSSDPNEVKKAKNYMTQVDQYASDTAGKPASPVFKPTSTNGVINDSYKMNPATVTAGNVNFKNLSPTLDSRLSGVNYDQSGLQALKDRATGTGPSPWLNQALSNNAQQTSEGVDTAHNQAAGSNAQAMNSLAMTGGLSGGARERAARAGSSNDLAASQVVRQTGLNNANNLALTDEATKNQDLLALPGAQNTAFQSQLGQQQAINANDTGQQSQDLATQLQNANLGLNASEYNANSTNSANQYNIQNALNDVLQNRAFDLTKYGQDMSAWGADKTANAQSSGKK